MLALTDGCLYIYVQLNVELESEIVRSQWVRSSSSPWEFLHTDGFRYHNFLTPSSLLTINNTVLCALISTHDKTLIENREISSVPCLSSSNVHHSKFRAYHLQQVTTGPWTPFFRLYGMHLCRDPILSGWNWKLMQRRTLGSRPIDDHRWCMCEVTSIFQAKQYLLGTFNTIPLSTWFQNLRDSSSRTVYWTFTAGPVTFPWFPERPNTVQGHYQTVLREEMLNIYLHIDIHSKLELCFSRQAKFKTAVQTFFEP